MTIDPTKAAEDAAAASKALNDIAEAAKCACAAIERLRA